MSTVEVIGRPSVLHEMRVEILGTMAHLAGHTVAIDALPDGSRPDVARVRPADRSVFLGDAKATETPGNTETEVRLRRYVRFLERYVAAGGSGAFALAVSTVDRFEWLTVIQGLCGQVVGGRRSRVNVIDWQCAVVSKTFSGPPS